MVLLVINDDWYFCGWKSCLRWWRQLFHHQRLPSSNSWCAVPCIQASNIFLLWYTRLFQLFITPKTVWGWKPPLAAAAAAIPLFVSCFCECLLWKVFCLYFWCLGVGGWLWWCEEALTASFIFREWTSSSRHICGGPYYNVLIWRAFSRTILNKQSIPHIFKLWSTTTSG